MNRPVNSPSAKAKGTIYRGMRWKYGKIITPISELRGVIDAHEMWMFNGYTNGAEKFTEDDIIVQKTIDKLTGAVTRSIFAAKKYKS